MTKRYDEQIDVTPDPIDADAPLTFLWRGRRYQIDQRLESWREGGEWWQNAGASAPREREYHRVLAHPYGASADGELDPDGFLLRAPSVAVYDLYRDRVADNWKLARVWD